MGQLLIEVPQNVSRSYRIDDSEFSERLLSDLEDFQKKTKFGADSAVVPPRRNSLKEDLENAFGIWADREESAEEIARQIRDRNNGKNE